MQAIAWVSRHTHLKLKGNTKSRKQALPMSMTGTLVPSRLERLEMGIDMAVATAGMIATKYPTCAVSR